jgi:hypothetical protein
MWRVWEKEENNTSKQNKKEEDATECGESGEKKKITHRNRIRKRKTQQNVVSVAKRRKQHIETE